MTSWKLGDVYRYWHEQLDRKHVVKTNSPEETRIIAAYSNFVKAAEQLNLAVLHLDLQYHPPVDGAQDGPGGGPSGAEGPSGADPNPCAIVLHASARRALPPSKAGRGAPPLRIMDANAEIQPVLSLYGRCKLLFQARRWWVTLMLFLTPIWSVVLPRVLIMIISRFLTMFFEGVVRGTNAASEQLVVEVDQALSRMGQAVADELDLSGSKISHVVSPHNATVGEACPGRLVPGWAWAGLLYVAHIWVQGVASQ